MSRMAVIVLEILNDFITGDLKTKRAARIIKPIQKLVKAARKYEVQLIYTNDAHFSNDFEVIEKWDKHAIKGTSGAEIIPEVEPAEEDIVVEKRVYSGFYTGLDSLLRSLYKGLGLETWF